MTSFNEDIFNPFRDPVYEEMGFIFDPERNQYFEIVVDPRFGEMRRYISPRDELATPELSDARIRSDVIDLMKRVEEEKRVGAVTDREARMLMKLGGLTKGRRMTKGYKGMTKGMMSGIGSLMQ